MPFPVRVPVVHADSPPAGAEAEIFTYKRATEYDENWVAIDLVTAKRLGRRFLNATRDLPVAAWTP